MLRFDLVRRRTAEVLPSPDPGSVLGQSKKAVYCSDTGISMSPL